MKPVAFAVFTPSKKATEAEAKSLTRRASRSQFIKAVKKAPPVKKSESPVKSLKSSKT